MLICFDFSSHFPTWAREKWFWTVFFYMSREIIVFTGNSHGKLHLSRTYFQTSFSFGFVLINITWAFCFKVRMRNLGLPKPGAKIPWLYLEWNPDPINKQDLTNAKVLNEIRMQNLLPHNNFLTVNHWIFFHYLEAVQPKNIFTCFNFTKGALIYFGDGSQWLIPFNTNITVSQI